MKPATNVFWMLDRTARAPYGGDPAITFDGTTRSFRDLRDRAVLVANGLRELGIGAGDRVAVLMGNRMEWPEVLFGIAALGAICVPVNVLLTGKEIAHVCADSGATCMIVDQLGGPALATLSALPELVVSVGEVDVPAGPRVVGLDDVLATATSTLDDSSGPGQTDPFMLYYSSGTTGLPKAAMHTHAGILWNSVGQIVDLGLDRSVVYLVVPSLSWAAGLHNVMLALLWAGGRSVLMPTGGTTPEKILDNVERHGATHIMLVPSLIRLFANDEVILERVRNSSLRWIVTGAEPVPRALIEVMNKELPDCRVCQGYGLSEFPTICTILTPDEALVRNGSAGRPLSHTSVAVRTTDGDIVQSGKGELLIRSLATMAGYYQRPEQNAEAFRDGWLHTGDLAEIDDDGFVSIIGRTKDMIISGGLNVYPKEVEDVLHGVAGIGEVAVVGVPDERFGERVVAVVVPAGSGPVDRSLIDEVCRENLASYKRPREVLVRSEPLPRNPTGKVLKRELRPWAVAELGAEPVTS